MKDKGYTQILSSDLDITLGIWKKKLSNNYKDLYVKLVTNEGRRVIPIVEYKRVIEKEIRENKIKNVIFIGEQGKVAWKIYDIAKFIKGLDTHIMLVVYTTTINLAILEQGVNNNIIDELIINRQHYNDRINAKYFNYDVMSTECLLKQNRELLSRRNALSLYCILDVDIDIDKYIEYARQLGVNKVLLYTKNDVEIKNKEVKKESKNQYRYKNMLIRVMRKVEC